MTTYNDTNSPELVERLQAFWKVQDVLKRDYEPFCQADLLFEPDTAERLDADQDAINPTLASQEPQKAHWHGAERPDDYYYLAAGQEPPRDSLGFYKGLWNLIEYWVPFAMVIIFVLIMLVVKK